MSYDIKLVNKEGEVCQVERHMEGGTYVIGGTEEASLNITFNYAPLFYDEIDREQGIRWLYDKAGKDSIERLERAIKRLGTNRDYYWKATPGNAGYALSVLLNWAKEHSSARFTGD